MMRPVRVVGLDALRFAVCECANLNFACHGILSTHAISNVDDLATLTR